MTDITNFREPLLRPARHGARQTTAAKDLTAMSTVLLAFGHREAGPARRTFVYILVVLPSDLGVGISNFL